MREGGGVGRVRAWGTAARATLGLAAAPPGRRAGALQPCQSRLLAPTRHRQLGRPRAGKLVPGQTARRTAHRGGRRGHTHRRGQTVRHGTARRGMAAAVPPAVAAVARGGGGWWEGAGGGGRGGSLPRRSPPPANGPFLGSWRAAASSWWRPPPRAPPSPSSPPAAPGLSPAGSRGGGRGGGSGWRPGGRAALRARGVARGATGGVCRTRARPAGSVGGGGVGVAARSVPRVRRGAAADGAARRSPPPPPCAAAPACAGASRQGWRREGRARSGRRGPKVVGTAPVASVGQRRTWINVQPSGWWPFFVFAFPYVAPQSATDGGRGGGGTGGDRGEGRGGADGRLPSDGDPAVVGARLVLPMACTGTRGRARRARGGTEPAHVGRGGDVAAWASPGGPTAKAKNRDLVRFSTVPTSQWRSRGGGQDAGSTPRPVGGANPFANSPPCPLGGDPPWVPGTAEWWVVSRCMLPSGPHLHQRAALTQRATVVAAASPVV